MVSTRFAMKALQGLQHTYNIRSFKALPASIRFAGLKDKKFKDFCDKYIQEELPTQTMKRIIDENVGGNILEEKIKFRTGNELATMLSRENISLAEHMQAMDPKIRSKVKEYAAWREKFLKEFPKVNTFQLDIPNPPTPEEPKEESKSRNDNDDEEAVLSYNQEIRAALQRDIENPDITVSALQELCEKLGSGKFDSYDDTYEPLPRNVTHEDLFTAISEMHNSAKLPDEEKIKAFTNVERTISGLMKTWLHDDRPADIDREILDAQKRVQYYAKNILGKEKKQSIAEYIYDRKRIQFYEDIDMLLMREKPTIEDPLKYFKYTNFLTNLLNESEKIDSDNINNYYREMFKNDETGKEADRLIQAFNYSQILENPQKRSKLSKEERLKMQDEVDYLNTFKLKVVCKIVVDNYPDLKDVCEQVFQAHKKLLEINKKYIIEDQVIEDKDLDVASFFEKYMEKSEEDLISLINNVKNRKEEYFSNIKEIAEKKEKDLRQFISSEQFDILWKRVQLFISKNQPQDQNKAKSIHVKSAFEPLFYDSFEALLRLRDYLYYNLRPNCFIEEFENNTKQYSELKPMIPSTESFEKMKKDCGLIQDCHQLALKMKKLIENGEENKIFGKEIRHDAENIRKKYDIPEPEFIPKQKSYISMTNSKTIININLRG